MNPWDHHLPPTDDWRKVGEFLRAYMQQCLEETSTLRDPPNPGPAWKAFNHRCSLDRITYERDFSPMIEFLRSGEPIDDHVANCLALVLEVFMRQEPVSLPVRPGRPPDDAVQVAARYARRFYNLWKEWNRTWAVKDHGASEEMKDRSVEIIIEDEFPQLAASAERIRDMMARSKERLDLD
ncbi:hypothetical protein [Rhizobium sp. RAF56]|uniref:hypothetical protein n=1 Tax=Rhizobium sp. RAF56 TaxID=3233062 RepID=UPI003F975A27